MPVREKITDASIPVLGVARNKSPMQDTVFADDSVLFPLDVMVQFENGVHKPREESIYFELAGPREMIYFDPSKVHAAIVTCGGLCPGTNSVIQALVMTLHYHYGVRHIRGIQYGLEGFVAKYGHEMVNLTPQGVSDIHRSGGTILGSSRGPQPTEQIIDCIEQNNLQMLFLIGGNGTMSAAERIYREIESRGLKTSIVGIPKTIDNDIHLVTRSFGFETAVGEATVAARAAHVEAEGAYNGIGLVKLMGRNSGFIGAYATMASKDVNFLLVPEQDFDLEGPKGFLAMLENRIRKRHHALVLVSEGAGQRFIQSDNSTDASGNARLGDIGVFMKTAITDYFQKRELPITLKYIDPSYIIRSVPPTANDNIFCGFLGRHAVHAAMSGKTGVVVAERNNTFVHLPIQSVTAQTRCIDLDSPLWQSVLESTGQPRCMSNK